MPSATGKGDIPHPSLARRMGHPVVFKLLCGFVMFAIWLKLSLRPSPCEGEGVYVARKSDIARELDVASTIDIARLLI